MLAVTQFFEDEDMAFVLDRMLSLQNPMSARLASGRYFVRFVVIEDPTQRRSICSALNQWMVSAAEKATGIGSHFATSLELTPATEYVPAADSAQQSLFPNKDVAEKRKNEQRAGADRRMWPEDRTCGADTPVRHGRHRHTAHLGIRGNPHRIPIRDSPAAKLRSRHQHSLSDPIPLGLLVEGFGWRSALALRLTFFARDFGSGRAKRPRIRAQQEPSYQGPARGFGSGSGKRFRIRARL